MGSWGRIFQGEVSAPVLLVGTLLFYITGRSRVLYHEIQDSGMAALVSIMSLYSGSQRQASWRAGWLSSHQASRRWAGKWAGWGVAGRAGGRAYLSLPIFLARPHRGFQFRSHGSGRTDRQTDGRTDGQSNQKAQGILEEMDGSGRNRIEEQQEEKEGALKLRIQEIHRSVQESPTFCRM